MAYQGGDLDATFASAAGEDTALLAELRAVFAASLARQIACCAGPAATAIGMLPRGG
jgi:hypothetical protein